MQARKTVAAALVFAALIIYIYFFEWNKETIEKAEKLLKFTPDEAETVALRGPAQEIRLQRDDSGRWKLTAPLQTRADDSAVESLLVALSGAQVIKTVVQKPTAEELKNFGLDPPSGRVSVTLKSGVTLPDVVIGAQTPVGSSVYARRDVKPDVLLADSQLQAALGRKLNDFRSKRILEIKEDGVKRLTLKNAKGRWVLTKKATAGSSTPRARCPPMPRKSEGFLVRCTICLPGTSSRPNLRTSANTASTNRGFELLSIKTISKSCCLSASPETEKARLLPPWTLLELCTPFHKPRSKISTAIGRPSAKSASSLLLLRKQPNCRFKKARNLSSKDAKEQWALQPTPKGRAHAQAIDAFVTALADLKAKAIAEDQPKDLKRYGLEGPSLKISVVGRGGEDLGTLLIGSAAQLDHYAHRAGSSIVYLIDDAAYRQIAKSPADFLAVAEQTAAPSKTQQ